MTADPLHDASRTAAAIAVASLRARWLSPPAPGIAEAITPEIRSDPLVLAEVITADVFERRSRGLEAGLDAYLREVPGLDREPAACRALLMSELVARLPEGLDRVEEDLLARFPALAESVRAVTTLARAFQDAVDQAPPKVPGAVLGKYELHARLGHGAFGETWQARDTVLERFVALKILHHAHLLGERGVRAFLQEARAAARLEHPSIVRIHEAGRFSHTGEYYIDSQLIGPPLERGGEPRAPDAPRTLDDLLRSGPTPPLRAATLIAGAARAVAAAHARGITHRDIKPSNILLATDGRPMVADFGLSVTTDAPPPGPSEAPAGRVVRVAGTPAYLAPELAEGQKPTPLSDVYALGATLRALLLGRHPVEPDASSSVDPVTQVIDRIRSESLPPLARECSGLPATLCAICDRATSRRPEDRYSSADQIASDLEAYVARRPTLARPPGAAGAALLWLRRNRVPAGAALLTAAALAALTIGFIHRLSLERDRALAARRDADTQRDAALFVRDTMLTTNQFIARAFNSTRGQEAGADFTALKTLELAAQRVGRTFADRPLVEASVRHFLGQAATGAGGFQVAREQLDRALEIRTQRLGPVHPDTLSTLRALADLDDVLGLRESAEERHRRVLEGLNEPEGAESPDTLRALSYLARAAWPRGEREAAMSMIRRADRGYTRLGYKVGADHQAALNTLVLFHNATQSFEQSLATQQRIVDMNAANLGPDDISTLNSRQAIGWILRMANRPDEAARVYRECLDRYTATVGALHPMALHVAIELSISELPADPASALNTIAPVVEAARTLAPGNQLLLRALIARGRAEDALTRPESEATFREALEASLRHRGPSHATTHEAATLLARVLERRGAADEARAVRSALEAPPAKAR